MFNLHPLKLMLQGDACLDPWLLLQSYTMLCNPGDQGTPILCLKV